MKWRTEIGDLSLPFSMGIKDRLFLIGSCFAENMGQRLRDHWWNVEVNALGIAYNPVSLFRHLGWLVQNSQLCAKDWFEVKGEWRHPDLHSQFSFGSQADAHKALGKLMAAKSRALMSTDSLVLTLGTGWVFSRKKDGKIVNNCHQLPADLFTKRCLTVEEVIKCGMDFFDVFFQKKPRCFVLVTVSPIRHLRLGMSENTLGKAVLISAVHKWVAHYKQVHYFPSYEIMMDDLRDYRYYAKDLIHPSDSALDYIWEKFISTVLTSGDQTLLQEVIKLNKRLEHRPMTKDPDKLGKWQAQNRDMLLRLIEQYPFFNGTKASNYLAHLDNVLEEKPS